MSWIKWSNKIEREEGTHIKHEQCNWYLNPVVVYTFLAVLMDTDRQRCMQRGGRCNFRHVHLSQFASFIFWTHRCCSLILVSDTLERNELTPSIVLTSDAIRMCTIGWLGFVTSSNAWWILPFDSRLPVVYVFVHMHVPADGYQITLQARGSHPDGHCLVVCDPVIGLDCHYVCGYFYVHVDPKAHAHVFFVKHIIGLCLELV
jgi:hypothetical protein